MGFTISQYTLMGLPLQNVYVTIKGRFSIQNNSFIYGMPNRYQIYSDFWFSLGKGLPSVQSSSVMINTDNLPVDLYKSVYDAIKAKLVATASSAADPTLQTLVFTDDILDTTPPVTPPLVQ
jgi:hypothetical protein